MPLGQVDDVLKSLVVYDSAGGIGGFDLPARDQAHASFGDVPFGPEALQSPLAYLNALQGVEIEVKGPRPAIGRIMRAETVNMTLDRHDGQPAAIVPRTQVTLLARDGLKQFVLEDADSVQVADPGLRAGIGKALEELRRSSSRDMRHLTLHTEGTAHRTVRVGYVVAAPLWKATYRLVLPDKDGAKGRLQGWAVLENDSGVDWNGVELTLQSGNPVTFRQALYQAYYVQRPEVPVEVLGRILPPEDSRTRLTAKLALPPSGAAPESLRQLRAAPAPAPMAPEVDAMAALAKPAETAAAADEGEETVFRLPTPVVLPAAHTASVPILDHEVPATRVDLDQGDAPHPLAAVKLANDAGLGLPAGVLTLYAPGDAATFAGDARLGGLPAGETRLLSFAQDLRTTVERKVGESHLLVSLAAADGVLKVQQCDRQIVTITATAPAASPQDLLLEIPKDGDRTLSVEGGQPAGTEETSSAWRVPVSLKAGEIRTVTAYLDRTLGSTIVLTPDSAEALIALADDEGLSPAAKASLDQLAALRKAASIQEDKVGTLDQGAEEIERDEKRLRDNLAAVPASDALHNRLVRQLEADEERIADNRRARDAADGAAAKARRDLAGAIAALKL